MQKKREKDAARAGENADDGGPDDTKARRKAAQKARNDPGSAQVKALKSAIAAVTAQEKKEWKAERYEQISKTDAYKDSEDKTRFMHDELAKIKDKEAAYRDNKKKEEAQAALQNWLRTGENPPVGMENVSEAERLAMFQQTDEYKNYQAGIAKWGQEQKALQNWLRTGENPPAGLEDVSEAERLAMYQQTDEYKNYQAGMAAWAAQQQQAQDDDSYDAVEHLRAANAVASVPQESNTLRQSLSDWWNSLAQPSSGGGQTSAQSYIQSFLNAVSKPFEPAVDWLNQNIYQPYIAPNLTIPKIAGTALAATLLGTSLPWVNNVLDTPNLFANANANMRAQFQALDPVLLQDPATKWKLFTQDPVHALSAGLTAGKALANSAAGYMDAIWQQNPLVPFWSDVMATDAKFVCSNVTDEAWARRCNGTFAFSNSVVANPTDTVLGFTNALVVDPVAGAAKLLANGVVYNPVRQILDLGQAIQKDGWQGVQDLIGKRIDQMKEIVSDPQVDSLAILAAFALLAWGGGALLAAGAAQTGALSTALKLAGIGMEIGVPAFAVGQSAATVVQIDQGLQAAATREAAMRFISSSQVRTTVAVTTAILLLVGAGSAEKIADFEAFGDGFTSPETKAAYDGLNPLDQYSLFETASNLKISPDALDFYLENFKSGDPSLAGIPLVDALRFSEMSTETGAGDFILEYLDRFSSDTTALQALESTPPEALKPIANFIQSPEFDGLTTGDVVDWWNAKPEIRTAMEDLPMPDQVNLVKAQAELKVSDDAMLKYLEQVSALDPGPVARTTLGQMNLVEGFDVSVRAQTEGEALYISGRLGDGTARATERSLAEKDLLQLVDQRKALGIITDKTKIGFDSPQNQAMLNGLKEEIAAKYPDLQFFQVKESTGASEVDWYVDPKAYGYTGGELTPQLKILEQQLIDIFDVENSDPYIQYSLNNIPAGSIKFGPDGSIETVQLSSEALRAPGQAAVENSVHSFETGITSPNFRPHTDSAHGPGTTDQFLIDHAGTDRVATRFETAADMNRAVQGGISFWKSEIEQMAASAKPGLPPQDFPSGEIVSYRGYDAKTGTFIEGQAEAKLVIYFDGQGHWGLLTAYPDVKNMQLFP